MGYKNNYKITTAKAMQELGAKFAQHYCRVQNQSLATISTQRSIIIYLQGDLGTGKTTWVRGFLRGLGFSGKVKSPTFTLVEPYSINNQQIYHFDLYRLKDPAELEYLGANDYFNEPHSLCLIEWPEYGGKLLPKADVTIKFSYVSKNSNWRAVTIETKYQDLLGE